MVNFVEEVDDEEKDVIVEYEILCVFRILLDLESDCF